MIPNDPEEIRPPHARGTWVAHQLVVRGIAALCVLSMACIPTEEIDFPEEPACPPSIVSPADAEFPIGEIIVLTQTAPVTPDAGVGAEELEFEVQVRDCNVDQDLTFNVWLDFFGGGGAISGFPIHSNETLTATGSSTRELLFSVPRSSLTVDSEGVGCHELELFVSSAFSPGGFGREPQSAGDIDSATWWIALRTRPEFEIPISECER